MGREKAPAWTAREEAILAEVYPREGLNGATDALPERSWRAIYVRASRMGLRSPVIAPAPRAKLAGAALAQAMRLREEGWSFARIGAALGVSESGACNAVTAALSRKAGFRPARRDEHGRLLAEEIERLRLMLRKGLKAIDIQLRMGLSASRVAEERRRYNRELKERGKAMLPPPGGGAAYSGVRLSAAKRREVEALLLEGWGTPRVAEKSGVSKTSVGRIRARLVRRLARRGECLPGCDLAGVRRVHKPSLRAIPDEAVAAFRARLLAAEPVRRAANALGIGLCSAYRLRDAFAAALAERGEALPPPRLPGRVKRTGQSDAWLPPEWVTRHRVLVAQIGLDAATAQVKAELAAAREKERSRRKSFEEQLAAVQAGARIAPVFRPTRRAPDMTLGGVATGQL